MRMSVTDKIIGFLSVMLSLCTAVLLIFLGLNAITTNDITTFINSITDNMMGIVIILLVAVFMILLCIKFVIGLFLPGKRMDESAEKIVLSSSEDGSVMVSLDVVKELSVKKAKEHMDVKDVNCMIDQGADGVRIKMIISFKKDVMIKEFLTTLKDQVKEYVEVYSGTKVAFVDLVADTSKTTTIKRK